MSEFRRLVLCVDNSGSMSGQKIQASMKFLNDLAKEFNVTTHYYKFTKTVKEVKKYDNTTLNARGGTAIENSLKELFCILLPKYSHFNDKTKFIFVTDAEDEIKNRNDIISWKTECESKYNNKNLDCECLLTSNSISGIFGSWLGDSTCSNDLKKIFEPQFHHCHNNDFKSVLDRLCAAIRKAQQIAPQLQQTQTKIQTITESATAEDKEVRSKMKSIQKKIKESDKISIEATTQIDKAECGIKAIESHKISVVKHVDSIKDRSCIKKTEQVVKPMKSQLVDHRSELCATERLLDKQVDILKKQSEENEKLREMLEKTCHGKEIECIISKINEIINRLNNIKNGAYHHVTQLKMAFIEQLDELMRVTQQRNETVQQFKVCQADIERSFEILRDQTYRIQQFKEAISWNIKDLNKILSKLDNKWDKLASILLEADLKTVLIDNKLGKYFQLLVDNGFDDLQSLKYLNENILIQMKIPYGHRMKLLDLK